MAYTLNHQTPSTGYISWSGVHIVFDGVDSAVIDGNTNKQYVYWLAAAPTVLHSSNDYPTLGADDAVIFINRNGVGVSVLDSAVTDGGLVVPGTVTSAAIATGAITADHITAGAIETEHLAAKSITGDKILVNSIEATHIIADAIEAGHLSANSVTTRAIEANAVTANEIAAGSITTAKIAAGAITAIEIAADTITAANIAASTITGVEIAAGAITTAKIAAGAVTANEIAADTITSTQIAAGTIGASELAIGATKFDSLKAMAYGNSFPTKTWGVWLNGVQVASRSGNGRGQNVCVFNRETHALVSTTSYDTYLSDIGGNGDVMAAALAALDSTVLVVVTTFDVCSFESTSDALRIQLKRCGASTAVDRPVGQTGGPYVLIGYPGLGEGNGIEQIKLDSSTGVPCEITAMWVDSSLVGANMSVSDLAPLGTTYIKDGAITTAKVVAGAITTNELGANAVTAAKIAAGTITATQIAADTITGSQIAAGSIGASEIAANAVTAKAIAIADFENLAANGDFSFGNQSWGTLPAFITIAADATNAYPGTKNVLTINSNAASNWLANENVFSCVGGDKFYLEWAGKSSGLVGTGVTVYVRFNDKDGNQISVQQVGVLTSQTAYMAFSGEITAPANAAKGYVQILSNVTAGVAYVGHVFLRRKSGGNLIVDGAITTSKLAAGAVTANEIAAGAITAGKLAVISYGQCLNKDPDMTDSSAWTLLSGNPYDFATASDGLVGTHVARSRAGLKSWINGIDRIPINKAKTYRFTGSIRQIAGSQGTSYLGVALFDANGNNIEGDGSQWRYFMPGSNTPLSWTTYSDIFGAGTANDFPSNAVTMTPLFIFNSNEASGSIQEVQNIRIEELIGNTLIQDDSITTSKIVAGAITANELAVDSVTAVAIAAGAVTATEIAAGAITTVKLAAGAVTAVNIAAETITASQVAANTLTSNTIAAGAITADKIAAGVVSADKLTIGVSKFDNIRLKSYGNEMADKTSGAWLNEASIGASGRGTTLIVLNRTSHAVVSTTTYDTFGALADRDALATALAALDSNSVILITTSDACGFDSTNNALRTQLKRCGASLLVDAFVGTTQYAYALIGYPGVGEGNGIEMGRSNSATEMPCELATLWMNSTLVGVGNTVSALAPLDSTYIKDGAILTAKIAAGAITADKIAANSITASQLAAGTITGDRIAANTITGSQIAANSIKASQIIAGDLTNLAIDPNGDMGVCIFSPAVIVDVGAGNRAYQSVLGVRDSFSPNWFAVQPGEQYYFSADMSWVSGPQTTSTIGFYGVTSAGSIVSWYAAASCWDYSAGWKTVKGSITIPAGVERVYLWWQRDGFDTSTCGVWNMRNLVIKKKISGGDLIVAGTIVADNIQAGAITDAKIAGYIHSSNYIAGSTGWRIDKSGSAEFNSVLNAKQLVGVVNRAAYWPKSTFDVCVNTTAANPAGTGGISYNNGNVNIYKTISNPNNYPCTFVISGIVFNVRGDISVQLSLYTNSGATLANSTIAVCSMPGSTSAYIGLPAPGLPYQTIGPVSISVTVPANTTYTNVLAKVSGRIEQGYRGRVIDVRSADSLGYFTQLVIQGN